MEDTSNTTNTEIPSAIPQLTSESAKYLLIAAKWSKFLALIGFIMTSLMIVAGILMSFVLTKVQYSDLVPMNSPFSARALSVFYISIAAIFLIPVSFLHAFSNKAINAVNTGNSEYLTSSFRNLKSLFVFVGISTLVLLSLYTLILIFAGAAAFMSF